MAKEHERNISRTSRPDAPSAERLAELEHLLALCEVQSVRSGVPFPLGAHFRGSGVNFAIFSRHATGIRLDFFDRPDEATERKEDQTFGSAGRQDPHAGSLEPGSPCTNIARASQIASSTSFMTQELSL
jgi:hypothetical protein